MLGRLHSKPRWTRGTEKMREWFLREQGKGGKLHRSESSLCRFCRRFRWCGCWCWCVCRSSSSRGPTKHELANVLPSLTALVNLHTNQMRFRAEPVHPPHTALPTTSHARTPLLVRLRNAALRSRALPERMPLLGRDAGHERGVHGIEHVEVRERS
jgi:hypothetical protein